MTLISRQGPRPHFTAGSPPFQPATGSCGLGAGPGFSAGGVGIGVVMVCAAKGGFFPAYSLLIRLNYRPLQVLCQELNTLNRPSSWGIINSGRGYFEVHSNTAVSITW